IHTRTVGTRGESALGSFSARKYEQPIVDTDDQQAGAPPQLQFPNPVPFPSNPPVGPPGGCGTQTQPCSYNGSTEINSGILCHGTCPNSEYFFRIDVASVPAEGLTVHYVCLIHGPTLKGFVEIVPADRHASRH